MKTLRLLEDVKTARPSVYVFRSAAAHLVAGAAAANGYASVTPAGAAERLFGRDVVTEQFIRRSTVSPAATSHAGWAGALVEQSVFDVVQVAASLSAAATLCMSAPTNAGPYNFERTAPKRA